MKYEEKLARLKVNSFSYLRSDWLSQMIENFSSAEELLNSEKARKVYLGENFKM